LLIENLVDATPGPPTFADIWRTIKEGKWPTWYGSVYPMELEDLLEELTTDSEKEGDNGGEKRNDGKLAENG